jgi:hypothetical protein
MGPRIRAFFQYGDGDIVQSPPPAIPFDRFIVLPDQVYEVNGPTETGNASPCKENVNFHNISVFQDVSSV